MNTGNIGSRTPFLFFGLWVALGYCVPKTDRLIDCVITIPNIRTMGRLAAECDYYPANTTRRIINNVVMEVLLTCYSKVCPESVRYVVSYAIQACDFLVRYYLQSEWVWDMSNYAPKNICHDYHRCFHVMGTSPEQLPVLDICSILVWLTGYYVDMPMQRNGEFFRPIASH